MAIELDDTNIKAHLICGQMLAEMAKNENGTEKLDNALNRMTKCIKSKLCEIIFENSINIMRWTRKTRF